VKVSERTITAIVEIVTGDKQLSRYRRGFDLVELFNEYGFNDAYGQGFPSRGSYTREKVRALNDTSQLARLVCQALHPGEFLNIQQEQAGACEYLDARLKFDGFEISLDADGVPTIRTLKGSLVAFEHPLLPQEGASEGFLREQLEKCDTKLRVGDYDGAITNARSLAEQVLTSLEHSLDKSAPDYDGDLLKLYKRIQRLLNLGPGRDDVDTGLKQVLTGLASIVAGLAGLSNKMGDRHARTYKPEKRHAVLIVDSVKTLCNFVISTDESRRQSNS
jgi:Abortive infection C-terminus